jgi:hypothetical protein
MMPGEHWREAYINFIRDQRLPAGMDTRSAEAARVMRRSKGFILVDNKLYRRGARSGVLIKCITKEDGYDILREIHEGVHGNHAASRTLVGKAYRAGFWWPTAVSNAEYLVRRCQNGQFFGKQSHVAVHSLITIPPSWLFACWSLDMIGPLSHPIYKNKNRAIIYAPGSSLAYIQQIIKISQHMSRIKAYKL